MHRHRNCAAILILLVLVGCSWFWPPAAQSADARLYWTFPDTTTTGTPVTEAYLGHFIVFHRENGGATQMWGTASIDSVRTYTGPIASLVGRRVGALVLAGLVASRTHEFAVASADTMSPARVSAMSVWSAPWRPADTDPGPPARPATIILVPGRVW